MLPSNAKLNLLQEMDSTTQAVKRFLWTRHCRACVMLSIRIQSEILEHSMLSFTLPLTLRERTSLGGTVQLLLQGPRGPRKSLNSWMYAKMQARPSRRILVLLLYQRLLQTAPQHQHPRHTNIFCRKFLSCHFHQL